MKLKYVFTLLSEANQKTHKLSFNPSSADPNPDIRSSQPLKAVVALRQ